MILCGDGLKIFSSSWRKLWAANCPNEPMMEPDGLKVDSFHDSGRLIVLITFPKSAEPGSVIFGVVVIGPCADPQWQPAARENLPFKYFILTRTDATTSIEDWTTDPPTPRGVGPDPDLGLFVEWVGREGHLAEAGIVGAAKDDQDVAAAVQRARAELPDILKRFLAGELHDALFTVKIPIREGDQVEYFWLSETTFSDGRFSGTIEDDPVVLKGIRRGVLWLAPMEDVADWMYMRDKKMHGNYTLRALLPKMPPEEAAKYRAVLFGD